MENGASRQAAAGKRLLDARLLAAYELTPHCRLCADIGADHGKLSAALLGEGRVEHMLVSDISEKALAKARKLLATLRLSKRATFVAADGLQALDALEGRTAEAICLLGLGGDTIAEVLRQGRARLGGAVLVLGAQTELPVLRQTLCDIGYRLREERVVEVTGRFYIVMQACLAVEAEAAYTEKELLLGPCLLRSLPDAWALILRRREHLLHTAQEAMRQAENQKDRPRLSAVEQELFYVREALAALAQKETE